MCSLTYLPVSRTCRTVTENKWFYLLTRNNDLHTLVKLPDYEGIKDVSLINEGAQKIYFLSRFKRVIAWKKLLLTNKAYLYTQ